MRLRALRKGARSGVRQTSDAGGRARRASAPKEGRAAVSLEDGGRGRSGEKGRGGRGPDEGPSGRRGALEGPRGAVTQRILEQIRMGRTVRAISAATGVSEVFVSTLLEHYDRLGMLDDAGSLCSSGLGACHTKDVSEQVRVACAGCPLVI